MAAPNMGITELGVQAGYHFTGRIGGAPAGRNASSLRAGDGIVDPAGRGLGLLVLQMLGRRQRKGLGGLGDYGACGHGRAPRHESIVMVAHRKQSQFPHPSSRTIGGLKFS
jgi:hypothetical protein